MSKTTNSDKVLRLLQISSANLVLQVFGGAGAIWGFSEAIGLRVASTVWFWRPCALIVGAIFFVRWLLQIRDYILEENIHISLTGNKSMEGYDEENVSLHFHGEKAYS